MNKKNPRLSIIIVSLNSERTIEECLKYIIQQTYSALDEVLLIDGGSTDKTLKIAKRILPTIKIIKGGYKSNQEARRTIGIKKARNKYCVFIDTDNYLLDKNWLLKMILPFLEDNKIIASQTLRYAAPRDTTFLNRYFGLFGAADPIAYYLGKADRLSWAFDRWNLLGNIINENKNYYTIEFDPNNYPTLGCNGIIFNKLILLKSKWGKPENYFHTDVFVDISKLGYNRFAIVKNEIFHNTADNLLTFLAKRKRYMKLHHQNLNSKRRYFVFNRKRGDDIFKLLLAIVYSLTVVVPFLESTRGYFKKRDFAWFLHPIVCLGTIFIYSQAIMERVFVKVIKIRR